METRRSHLCGRFETVWSQIVSLVFNMYIFMKKHTISYTLALVLLSFGSFAQELAKGYVFEDRNGNGEKERIEDGIAGVSVTNGVDVVQTDRKGYYELMVGDDNIIAVIKPGNYNVPVNQHQLPQLFYIHKPAGSPELEYKGVAPTGDLPKREIGRASCRERVCQYV